MGFSPDVSPPRLFLVVLGGRLARANIELHDVRFVAAASIEDAFPLLRQQWFGSRRGLHLDSYLELNFVDGYRVELRNEPFPGSDRLWFVNFGGYDPEELAELHRFSLFVAPTARAAAGRARRSLLPQAIQRHKDDLHAVDDCLALERVQTWWVHLVPDGRSQPFRPDWYGYRLI
jgi:hypothetical protein